MLLRVLILVLSGSAFVLCNPVVKGPINKPNELPGGLPNRPDFANNACQKLDELRMHIRGVTSTIKDLQRKALKESDKFVLLENVALLVSKYDELSGKNKALKKEIETSQKQGCKKAQKLVSPEVKDTLQKIEAARKKIIGILKTYLSPAMTDNNIISKKKRDIPEKRNSKKLQSDLGELDQELNNLVKDLRKKRSLNIGDA